MPRILVPIVLVLVLVLVGVLYFLSTVPKQQPTRTIEVEVPQGNAH